MLYQKSYDRLLFHCLSENEMQATIQKAHDGMCGAYQFVAKLWDHLQRTSYYWLKMLSDDITCTKRCHACQVHADYLHI